MTEEFAVVGAGRFGRSVALSLTRQRRSVLVVDIDAAAIERVASEVDGAVCADATDERAFAELHLERFACVIVGIGAESRESSILVTALLKQRGVPRIVARATSALHGRVLRAVGADEVVNPEREVGERLANRIVQPNLVDQLPLDEHTVLAEIGCPVSWDGKTLVELNVRKRYGVSVIAMRRAGTIAAHPSPTDSVCAGDVLVMIGSRAAMSRIGSIA